MNYASIFKGRCFAMLKDITSLVIILIAVILSVVIGSGGMPEKGRMYVAVVNEDEGELGDGLADLLLSEEDFDMRLTDRQKAISEIADNNAHGMILIQKDFTKKVRSSDYEDLVEITIMADSYDMNMLGELLINDTIKIWMEELIEKKLSDVDGIDEEDISSFRMSAVEVMHGESLLDVEAHPVGDSTASENEDAVSGLSWYAVFALFYLMISGTWMCSYGSGSMLKRVVSKGGNVSWLFICQSLPGILVSCIGFLVVMLFSDNPVNLSILISFILYIAASSAMSLLVCAGARSFSNLVFMAPVVTMAVSLVSGMLCKLPDWAKMWDKLSLIFPGHWFNAAVSGESFLMGGLAVTVFWFLVALLFAEIGVRRKN